MTDLFKEANDRWTIFDLWELFDCPGSPYHSPKTPWRDEKQGSFSIYANGTRWSDHGTGDHGDAVEFIRNMIQGTHADVRQWLKGKLDFTSPLPQKPRRKPPARPKVIRWPDGQAGHTIKPRLLKSFAEHHGIAHETAEILQGIGELGFGTAEGELTFIIGDGPCHEIRRWKGGLFSHGSKAWRLSGVRKHWPIGGRFLAKAAPSKSIVICEGSTDFLSAMDYFWTNPDVWDRWLPVSFLGASCRELHPDLAKAIKDRHVRIIPDADAAGMSFAKHWVAKLADLGCSTSVLALPHGMDLTDAKRAGIITAGDVFPA